MNSVKKLKSESTELPDCVISYIFSKLSLKNLVKTSALSKHWYHEWGSRKDLTFDLHNMFDYNTMPDLPIALPLFQPIQSQFAASLDNFMQKYPGDMIRSIRLNFPLDNDHTYAIDELVHKGVLKGANRIELLLAYKTDLKVDRESYKTDFKLEPYKFLFPHLSGPNSLTYLHLQNCHIAATMEFSGLKNLKTLVLTLVPVEQNMLQDLFLNTHLENLTLNLCWILSDLKINSTTLLHLKVICGRIRKTRNIDIVALNLLSIEYSSKFFLNQLHKVKINSQMLSKLTYRHAKKFNVEFSKLTNVTTIVLDHLLEGDVITHLFSNCPKLERATVNMCLFTCDLNIISATLRHLSIVRCYHKNDRTCKIDIHASNLSSFEFRGYNRTRSIISLQAPKLLKVFWDAGFNKINVNNYAKIAGLHHPENFAMPMTLSQISELTKEYLVQFKKLRQLELYIAGAYNPSMDNFWILDLAMASQHLQKLSLTIRNGHSEISHIDG
ncbi:uncharacterized protein LOC131621647 [Vicia villosa]|uniref:uncharacterized protein LOC131621647 n=1 Tax=Vicia villosa TaxID=3911 RepID=UPI00273AF25E|nr:uncharacterized protein LOC131621647 [Vicia villosa]